MGFRKTWIFGAALCVALLCAPNSQAGPISFFTFGDFTPPGPPPTSTYTNVSGAVINYDSSGVLTATAPPSDNTNLGSFSTLGSSGASSAVSSVFTLTVENLATFDFITFTGTLTGSLSGTSSNADIQFSSPLSQTLDGFVFTIANADSGHPGQVNINDPTNNNGVSTINAVVSSAVPEPSSIALLGLAVPALAGLAYRRARR
jgi:hypothetical protein